LASRVSERAVTQRLAMALAALTQGRVLLIHLAQYRDKAALKDWARIERGLNGEVCFAKEIRHSPHGYDELHLQVTSDPAEPKYVAPLLGHLAAHFDYVLLQLDDNIAVPPSIEFMIQSDLT